jgi:hypothetical protein
VGQPTGVLRRIQAPAAMAHIAQERCACRHRLSYPPLLLLPQSLCDALGAGDQPHQRLCLMRVELIDAKEPRGLRIGGDGRGNRRRKVFFRAAWPAGRCHDCSGRHGEVCDQALRPMAELVILGALDEPGWHGQGGRGTLQRLSPRLLIRTDDMASVLSHGWRLLIHGTHGRPWGGTGDGGIRLGVEPVRDPMRLHSHLIVKTARPCGC